MQASSIAGQEESVVTDYIIKVIKTTPKFQNLVSKRVVESQF